MITIYYFFAAYGDHKYGSGIYGDGGAGGALANTGFFALVAVTAACLLMFFALFIRFWHRKRKPSVSNRSQSDS